MKVLHCDCKHLLGNENSTEDIVFKTCWRTDWLRHFITTFAVSILQVVGSVLIYRQLTKIKDKSENFNALILDKIIQRKSKVFCGKSLTFFNFLVFCRQPAWPRLHVGVWNLTCVNYAGRSAGWGQATSLHKFHRKWNNNELSWCLAPHGLWKSGFLNKTGPLIKGNTLLNRLVGTQQHKNWFIAIKYWQVTGLYISIFATKTSRLARRPEKSWNLCWIFRSLSSPSHRSSRVDSDKWSTAVNVWLGGE